MQETCILPHSLVLQKERVDKLEFHMKWWGFETKRNKSFVSKLGLRVAPIKMPYHAEIWVGRKKFVSMARVCTDEGLQVFPAFPTLIA